VNNVIKNIRRVVVLVLVVLFLANSLTVLAADSPSSWASDQVNKAITAGIVPAVLRSDYTKTITRAEFCALAVAMYERIKGEIPGRTKFNDTTDVNVEKMAAVGVVDGIGNNNFGPNGNLNREQAATILSRLASALGKPFQAQESTFSDNSNISSWAIKAVGEVQAAGIMTGTGNNNFSPKAAYTREQSILTIFRLYDALAVIISVKNMSLIDNRLTIAMPEGSYDAEMSYSIMSAAASSQEYTRIFFDRNEARMVVYAYELFLYSGGDIAEDAKWLIDAWSENDGAEYYLTDIATINDIEMAIIKRSELDTSAEAIFLSNALIKMPDDTLINVSFYVNPAMLSTMPYCVYISEYLMQMIYIGDRKMDTSAHSVKMWSYEIETQNDYIVTVNSGIDFDVYYITKIVTRNESQPGMGIYIGGHPSGGGAPTGVSYEIIPDKVFGEAVEWVSYERNGIKRMETVFVIPGSDYFMMHIFISAYDEKDLDDMLKIVHSLKNTVK